MDSMMLFYIIMIVSLGAYFQTVTGFGHHCDWTSALIWPVLLLLLVYVIQLCNGINWQRFRKHSILLVLGIVPGVIAGVWLLII